MPRDLMTVLKQHKSCLKSFRLDFDDDWYKEGWEDRQHEELLVGDLTNFGALETLDISQQAMLGLLHAPPEDFDEFVVPSPLSVRPRLVNILPANIGELTIRYCGECINDDIEELSRTCLSRYPKVSRASCSVSF